VVILTFFLALVISTLKMEAKYSSETSVYNPTRRHIPEDGMLHSHRRFVLHLTSVSSGALVCVIDLCLCALRYEAGNQTPTLCVGLGDSGMVNRELFTRILSWPITGTGPCISLRD
jgi:hypothetical protein